jgi:hypothetical protein
MTVTMSETQRHDAIKRIARDPELTDAEALKLIARLTRPINEESDFEMARRMA